MHPPRWAGGGRSGIGQPCGSNNNHRPTPYPPDGIISSVSNFVLKNPRKTLSLLLKTCWQAPDDWFILSVVHSVNCRRCTTCFAVTEVSYRIAQGVRSTLYNQKGSFLCFYLRKFFRSWRWPSRWLRWLPMPRRLRRRSLMRSPNTSTSCVVVGMRIVFLIPSVAN